MPLGTRVQAPGVRQAKQTRLASGLLAWVLVVNCMCIHIEHRLPSKKLRDKEKKTSAREFTSSASHVCIELHMFPSSPLTLRFL
jgi:hypothetical protein